MADTRTPAQIKRDNFLRSLATDPGEGLRQWKRLQPGEQYVVITYMTLLYDVDFAKHFKANADKHRRPDLVITVTNDSTVTPQSLRGQGFRLQRTTTNLATTQFWIHPTGREVWVISSAKYTVPPPPAPPPAEPPVHPDIEEIRGYVADYSKRKDEMIAGARAIEARRGSLSPEQYKEQRDLWWKQYEEWEQEMDEIKDQVIPDMDGDLTPQEEDQKGVEIRNLTKIGESWPRDVMEPSH